MDRPRRLIARLFNVEPAEAGAVIAGFALFFLLFSGYAVLRPVREAMGIAGGVENLQWLFTGTFIAILAATPVFGWLAARVPRRHILPWTYIFFISNLALFALGLDARPDNIWLARGFFIWLSVFNLLAISVAWSILTDLFTARQAERLFALIAAGASLGGLVGPALGIALVGTFGSSGLLWLAASFLVGAIGATYFLQGWGDRHASESGEPRARAQPLGGSPFAGATAVARSRYMLAIAGFVVLMASVSTFLYFEQARLVEQFFPQRADQIRVFSILDIIVQSLSILAQLFVTGRIAQRLGVGTLLVAVPLVITAGFLWLALAPTFAVLAVVMVVRRTGQYAFVRPGREMLFTVLSPEAKYKAKNFIDTAVGR